MLVCPKTLSWRHISEVSMWHKWKLVRLDGTPTKDYIGQNGQTLDLKDRKYSFLLYENGAVAVQWSYGEWYGPWTEVIDRWGWELKFANA